MESRENTERFSLNSNRGQMLLFQSTSYVKKASLPLCFSWLSNVHVVTVKCGSVEVWSAENVY